MTCSGLDAEAMARCSVEPSTKMMAGQEVPRLFCSDTDRGGLPMGRRICPKSFLPPPICALACARLAAFKSIRAVYR